MATTFPNLLENINLKSKKLSKPQAGVIFLEPHIKAHLSQAAENKWKRNKTNFSLGKNSYYLTEEQ